MTQIESDPPSDLEEVIREEIKYVISILDLDPALSYSVQGSGISVSNTPPSFTSRKLTVELDIYFLQNNKVASSKALKLRDAVLRLRNNGAFVAVPLLRVNEAPVGPHPVGKMIPVLAYLNISPLWLQDLTRYGVQLNPSLRSSPTCACTAEI